MQNILYSKAAEIAYQRFLEIKAYSESGEFSEAELDVLDRLKEESLLLCSLAAKSISYDERESC